MRVIALKPIRRRWTRLPDEAHRLPLFGGRVVLTGTLKSLFEVARRRECIRKNFDHLEPQLTLWTNDGAYLGLCQCTRKEQEERAVAFYGVMLKEEQEAPLCGNALCASDSERLCVNLLEEAV